MTRYFTKSRVIVIRVSKDCPNEAVFLLNKTFSNFKRTPTLAKPDSIFRDMHAPVKLCGQGKGEGWYTSYFKRMLQPHPRRLQLYDPPTLFSITFKHTTLHCSSLFDHVLHHADVISDSDRKRSSAFPCSHFALRRSPRCGNQTLR